jgi:type IV pilus assembly protein PilB
MAGKTSTTSRQTSPDHGPQQAVSQTNGPPQLGQLLLNKGLLTQEQLEEALSYQSERGHHRLLGEVLVELHMVTAEQVAEVLAGAYGVPFARVSPKIADPKVIEVLPRDFIESQCVMPLFLVNGKLTIAVPEPANVFLIEEVERLSGYSVQIVAATAHDIQQTIQAHLPSANVFVIDDIVEELEPKDFSLVERQVTDLGDLEEVAEHSPVIKLVNYLVYCAVEEGASDVHIEPDDSRLRVRYRVDGRLYEKICPPYQMHAAVVSRVKIMANLDISERRIPQDGGIHVLLKGRPIDLRVSTMPGKFGEKVVIRIIDNRDVLVSLEKIGFNYQMLQRFKQVLHQPNGMILLTGPTGAGKSTTLYAMLAELNDPEVNLCTVEDPIELNLKGVNQFQVNEKAGFLFSNALRALLRQDPDIVMVGEIRDAETARIATQAALTGHLVLSTLHTNDAPSAVTRLFNIGVEPYLVAASLKAVLAQRLVRKLCSNCKEPVEVPQAMMRAVTKEVGPVETLYHGCGCAKCRRTGFSGRIGVFELLEATDELLDIIVRGANLQELREAALAKGYITLRRDGMEKVKAGLTTVEEVLNVTTG